MESENVMNWQKVHLGDVATVIGGGTPSTSHAEYWNGDVSWITPKDLTGYTNIYINKGERSISQKGLENSSARILPEGTVLLTTRAPIGYVAIASAELCTNQGFKSFIGDNKKLHNLFLYYWLKGNTKYLQSIGTGTTFMEIPGKRTKEIEIPLPPLPIRKAIAATLSCLDDKIELNNRINANLEAQAQAIFKSWFVDFEPFREGEFVDSELGKIPKGWRVVRLLDVCHLITKGTTPTTLKRQFAKYGINFIKAESISDNHSFDIEKFAYIDEDTNMLLRRSIIEEDDIVFTMAGTIGRFAYVDKYILPANTNQAVAIIRVNRNIISPYVIYSYLLAGWQNHYYFKNIQQAVQANLSLASIGSLPILLPRKDHLEQYEDIITRHLYLMLSNNNQSRLLASIRDALLPRLMLGEIEILEFSEHQSQYDAVKKEGVKL